MNLIVKLTSRLRKIGLRCAEKLTTYGITKQKSAGCSPQIVCVSHDAGFYGAQLLTLHIAEVLKLQLGYKVSIVLLGDGPLTADFARIGPVIDFTRPPWRQEASANVMSKRRKKIARLYKDGSHHVICNTSASGGVVRLFKDEGFHVISLIHELPTLIHDFNLEGSVKEIGKWADSVIFPAKYVRDRFIPLAELDTQRAIVRPQGLYHPSPYRDSKYDAREYIGRELKLKTSDRIVVAVGQGERRKGIDIFCQVAEDVVSTMPDVHFVWIGDDTTQLAKQCAALIQAGANSGNVHFTGVISDTDLCLRYIAAADIYLMTSREDPYPSVILEAMDVALPVVGFMDAGGFSELLENGAGILVDYEDQNAMGAAVKQLLLHSDQALQLGKQGQKIIDTRFYFLDYVYDLVKLVGLSHFKISVIVPNFNYAHYLPSRLGSIITQTYKPYEIIFLDDNSTDNSVEIAEEILSKSGLPYRVIVNDINKGCYAQWLYGIDLVKGELVWIAEADDESEPSFLSELVKGFDNPDVALAYSQSRKIDESGNLIRGDYLDYTDDLSETKWLSTYTRSGHDEIKDTLSIKNTIPNASAVLMKKPDLSGISERLLGLKNSGDWLTYVHILESGSIYFTPEVLNSHRLHVGGVTLGGNALRLMTEIMRMQEYVQTLHDLNPDTMDKIEEMRQFTYEYLKLHTDTTPTYRDHLDLGNLVKE